MKKPDEYNLGGEILRLQKMLNKAIVFKLSDGRLRITVESRGDDRWVVCDGGCCLNRDGEFEYEPLNSNRGEEFIARTRFSFEEAWELAEAAASKVE